MLLSSLLVAGFDCPFGWQIPRDSDDETQREQQERGTGLVLQVQEERYAGLAREEAEAGEGLPPSVDLSQWLPPARDQGRQPACVGFALGYALKTYYEARERGWDVNLEWHQFSPSFIFDRIHEGDDCTVGASIKAGLDLLINEGCLPLDRAPYDPDYCTAQAGPVDLPTARRYRIRNYRIIAADDLPTVKAYLAQAVPVVIGIRVYPQWRELAGSDAQYDSPAGEEQPGHVLLAVGYDDNREGGGAIRVFNSYGPDWGDNGYAWILYAFWPMTIRIAYVAEDEVEEPSVSFKAPVSYWVAESGLTPADVTAADLDRDGHLDLAVAYQSGSARPYLSGGIYVLPNNGDGTFAEAITCQTTEKVEPACVAVGDLDGDGDIDLAVADRQSHNVSVLLNDGNSVFATAVSYRAGEEPFSIALGDLNGDLDPDLAVANWGGNGISILLNNGYGTFAPPVNWAVGEEPICVALGDLDGDSDLDLAVANMGANEISVLLNHGDGTFAPAADYRAGEEPACVAVGDLDGNGYLDLAVANRAGNDISVVLNNGDGTFGPAVGYPAGEKPTFVAAGDLDGDGKLDLAVAYEASSHISILLNNEDGTFGPVLNFAAGLRPMSITIGDLDGDSDLDLAVANEHSEDVSVLLNQLVP